MLGTDFVLKSVAADGVAYLFIVPGGLVDPGSPSRSTGGRHRLGDSETAGLCDVTQRLVDLELTQR